MGDTRKYFKQGTNNCVFYTTDKFPCFKSDMAANNRPARVQGAGEGWRRGARAARREGRKGHRHLQHLVGTPIHIMHVARAQAPVRTRTTVST